jgi:hypothetical protein
MCENITLLEVRVSAKRPARKFKTVPVNEGELVELAPETIERLRLRVMNQIALYDHQFLFSIFPLWDQQKGDRE